jgi:hypothetical protein
MMCFAGLFLNIRMSKKAHTPQKTPLPTVLLLLNEVTVDADRKENTSSQLFHCRVLHSRCLATALSAGIIILAFSRHATMLFRNIRFTFFSYNKQSQFNLLLTCIFIYLTLLIRLIIHFIC